MRHIVPHKLDLGPHLLPTHRTLEGFPQRQKVRDIEFVNGHNTAHNLGRDVSRVVVMVVEVGVFVVREGVFMVLEGVFVVEVGELEGV